jgi:hypothetical protein
MKRIFLLIMAIACMAVLFSCKKADNNALGTYKVDVTEAVWTGGEGAEVLIELATFANETILKQLQGESTVTEFPYSEYYCSLAKGAYHFFEGQRQGVINNHLGGKVKLVWEEKGKPSNVKVIETYSYTPAMH